MIRKEQIQEKASELGQKYFPNEHNIWARKNIEAKYVELAFIEGAKWADEHPKEGLVSIDKVYTWILKNTYKHVEDNRVSILFSSTNEMMNDLRTTMEK